MKTTQEIVNEFFIEAEKNGSVKIDLNDPTIAEEIENQSVRIFHKDKISDSYIRKSNHKTFRLVWNEDGSCDMII